MKSKHAILASALALGLALAACSMAVGAGERPAAKEAKKVTKADPADLRTAMRKLWEDHVTWTRLYIVSAAAGLKDQQVTAERLLKNQDDIGNAIKPYYGDAAGAQLTALLRDHILTAADLVAAAKAGQTAKVETEKTAWYANADEIAAFLAKANPTYWPQTAISHHMKMHLDLTLDEAVAQLQGKWSDSVVAYDRIHDAILVMSDDLANGIIAQFPQKFSR
ncbi:MAG: hypothetical protein WAT66_07935 [Actinomycetota bacterium]